MQPEEQLSLDLNAGANMRLFRHANTLTNVPATLRALADNIEAGAYGPIARCVYVLRTEDTAEPPIVGAGGRVEHTSRAFMDLHAGAAELLRMANPERV